MVSRHYRQSARACTAPKGRPVTVISANFGSAAAGPGNSEKCRPGACCGGPARGYRHELRMSDARMPSQIYRKVEMKDVSKQVLLGGGELHPNRVVCHCSISSLQARCQRGWQRLRFSPRLSG